MIGMRLVRGMRFHVNIVDVTVRRDLKQVGNGQGQDYARQDGTRESVEIGFHNLGKLTPETGFVNLGMR
jgi:hypothetical protein